MTGKGHDWFQLERLAFFSDAVFAIAMTLLAIEIKVPHVDSDPALARALLGLVPQYTGFVVSFLVIGRFWLGHHRLFGLLARTDDRLVSHNLRVLMLVAFGPFPTAVFSDYAQTGTAVALYTGWLAALGVLYIIMMRYAARTKALHGAEARDTAFARLKHGAWAPVIIAALALAAGLVRPEFALIPLILSPVIMAGLLRLHDWRADAS